MARLKILDLRDTHEIGGPGKTILESFRAIDHDRFDLHVGVFRAWVERDDTPFLAAARAFGMPIHEGRGGSAYDPRQVRRLAQIVRDGAFDIVHAHEAVSDVLTYLMSFLHRVPIVSTAHGWIANSRKGAFMVALDKRVLARFDCVIAVSRKMQRDLVGAGAPEAKVTLLHNAIVLENYRRSDGPGALASLVGRRLPSPVMVSIGRLSPEKGHADLIDALAIVAARGRHIATVLAGDGPARADLEQRIRAAGLQDWVHLPGYIDRPARLLQDADSMVLPSHTEGLPNAALEALAMQVPVLATNVGGTPEVVVDGETGRLVPAKAPEALAAGILDFLDDRAKWQDWARRGRQTVEEHFDFKARTRKLEALYVEIMDSRGQR